MYADFIYYCNKDKFKWFKQNTITFKLNQSLGYWLRTSSSNRKTCLYSIFWPSAITLRDQIKRLSHNICQKQFVKRRTKYPGKINGNRKSKIQIVLNKNALDLKNYIVRFHWCHITKKWMNRIWFNSSHHLIQLSRKKWVSNFSRLRR